MNCEDCEYNTKIIDSSNNWCHCPAFPKGVIVKTRTNCDCDYYKRSQITIDLTPPLPPKPVTKAKMRYNIDELREITRKRQQSRAENKFLESEDLSEYVLLNGKPVLKKILKWFEPLEKED